MYIHVYPIAEHGSQRSSTKVLFKYANCIGVIHMYIDTYIYTYIYIHMHILNCTKARLSAKSCLRTTDKVS